MLNKKKPFSGMNKKMHLKAVCIDGQRPPIDRQMKLLTPDIAHLFQECWHQDMDLRPSFSQIVVRLREICTAIEAAHGEPNGRRSPIVTLPFFSRSTTQTGASASSGASEDDQQVDNALSSRRRWLFKRREKSISKAKPSSSWF